MPEGPEVKIIGEGLSQNVGIRHLVSVIPVSGRYTKKPLPGIEDMTENLPARVVGIGVKGKLIFWMFNNDRFLLNTLGMTGSWSTKKEKYSRIRFDFDTGDSVFFNDKRNFGTLKFVVGKWMLKQKLNSLGPDMLSGAVSDELFCERLDKKPYWTIAKALMNQTIVCGVGNYVKAEALYRAKISPHRLVGSLSSEDMSDLNDAVQYVLKTSYTFKGATLRDYRSITGEAGQASRRFLVYGHKEDPAGNAVVKEKTTDGRTTHWVPDVQK